MDLFPDGGFVRLESRGVPGKFVHAEADWETVSLHPNGDVPALNAVWRVQHRVGEGYAYVLLQNAAYGRYLSYSTKSAQLGHHGRVTTQRNHSEPTTMFDPRRYPYPWMWTVHRPPRRVQLFASPRRDEAYVCLRYINCYLCANPKIIFTAWNNRVTADRFPAVPGPDRLMHWAVHRVEASPVPQPLPLALEHQGNDSAQYPHPPRTIRHVRANHEGEFDQNHHNWDSFALYDNSVISLKNQLQQRQGWNEDVANYTLCVQPGSHGRLMPLVTDDLPGSLDSMNIVVFRTGTPGAAALRYPAAAAAAAAAAADGAAA